VRHAIVTGGSSGIGLAVVRRLLAAGWRVSVLALGDDDLDRLEREPPSSPEPLHLEACDVGERADVERAIASAVHVHGDCDLLLTSAGVTRPGEFGDLDAPEFERQVRINYLGTLWPVREVVPSMVDRGSGSIVMISSFAALVGVYGYSAYAPTKHAVRGLAETLRTELRPRGVHVACVFPTDVDTPMLASEEPLKPAATRALSSTAAVLSPEHVADAILRGIASQRFEIHCDTRSRLLARLAGAAPGLSRRILDRVVTKATIPPPPSLPRAHPHR
jgi:3-dehydrosphinganine reductase